MSISRVVLSGKFATAKLLVHSSPHPYLAYSRTTAITDLHRSHAAVERAHRFRVLDRRHLRLILLETPTLWPTFDSIIEHQRQIKSIRISSHPSTSKEEEEGTQDRRSVHPFPSSRLSFPHDGQTRRYRSRPFLRSPSSCHSGQAGQGGEEGQEARSEGSNGR